MNFDVSPCIILPPLTQGKAVVGHERVMTHTVILVCYHTEINQQPFQRSMSLSRGNIYLTNMTRGHYPTRPPPLT